MSIAKKKAFNEKMSLKKLYPNHQNLAKGGMVQKFGDGGTVGPSGITGQVSNLLGTNDNYQAGTAQITPGTNTDQLNGAYTGAQTALSGQQQLANTLAPGAAQGANTESQLANEFNTEAAGGGPNVAGTQLNTATGQNIAGTAALQAGQRGASSNVGLIARQAAGQGAATQQQAAGQAATLEQQQEIAAQQNAANLAQNQIDQGSTAATNNTSAQQGEQNIVQGANTAANNANVGMQSNVNSVNAGTAQANQAQNTKILGGIGSLAGSLPAAASFVSSLFSKGGEVHQTHVHNYAAGGIVTHPEGMGIFQAAGGQAASSPNVANAPSVNEQNSSLAASGGAPTGGAIPTSSGTQTVAGGAGDSIGVGAADTGITGASAGASGAAGIDSIGSLALLAYKGGRIAKGPHQSHVANYFAEGGKTSEVPALVSANERYLNPEEVRKVVQEGADPFKLGRVFPGKDPVPGKDSKKNDVIPTTLEEGGVVLDLNTVKKKNSDLARRFVEKSVAKHMKKPKGV